MKGGRIMDEKRIRKALKNDDEAFVELIMEKKEKLKRIAYKYCLNDAMCEDAISETIYQAYKNRKKCREPQYFDTWLIRILINNCLKEINQQKKNYELKIDIHDHHQKDIPLRFMVYGLDEPERSIIILHFFEKATLKEIAEYLNMPLSTIKSKYYKVLEELKYQLKEEEYE